MKPKFFVFAAVCALASGPFASAQADSSPREVQAVPPAPQPKAGGPKTETFFALNRTDVRSVFKMLGTSLKCTFIIADDVKGTFAGVVNGQSRDDIVNNFCDVADLTWGKTGLDTYLIVRRAPSRPVAAIQVVPRKPNDFIIGPAGPEKLDSKQPKSWQPFEFNGQKLYIVPTTPTAPKNQVSPG